CPERSDETRAQPGAGIQVDARASTSSAIFAGSSVEFTARTMSISASRRTTRADSAACSVRSRAAKSAVATGRRAGTRWILPCCLRAGLERLERARLAGAIRLVGGGPQVKASANIACGCKCLPHQSFMAYDHG